MKLSPHFTLAELTASTKATVLGIDNTPPEEIIPRLILLSEMLERVRAFLGVPVIVSSGYRCPRLNTAVGGVTSSDHTQGHAGDIAAPKFGSAFVVASALAPKIADLGIGQIIFENTKSSSWVHISNKVPTNQNSRILTFDGRNYAIGIKNLA